MQLSNLREVPDWFSLPARGHVRSLLTVVTCVLLAASVFTSYFIVQRQSALKQVSRYNVTWLTSQAPVEVMRLIVAVDELAQPGSGVDLDQVQLRLDIVRNRLNVLDHGEAADFIAARADLQEAVTKLRTMIAQAQPLIDQLGRRQSIDELRSLISPLIIPLVKLAGAANAYGAELVMRDQAELGRLHTIFSAIIAGLILCSFGMIGIVSRHNRLLVRANLEVKGLLQSLQLAATELADANAQVKETMEEVKLQNQILQERDRTLKIHNARFDAALNNMSQALCMVDDQQRIIVCNLRFRELFGLSIGMVQPGALIGDVFRNAAAVRRYERGVIEAIVAEQQELARTQRAGSFFQEDSGGTSSGSVPSTYGVGLGCNL